VPSRDNDEMDGRVAGWLHGWTYKTLARAKIRVRNKFRK